MTAELRERVHTQRECAAELEAAMKRADARWLAVIDAAMPQPWWLPSWLHSALVRIVWWLA